MLSKEQVAQYHCDGFIKVESALDSAQLQLLQSVTSDYIDASRAVTKNDDVYDLDDGHSARAPRLNRIKTPYSLHSAYRDVLQSDRMVSLLKPILGNDIRLQNSKLNTKASNGGAAVQWHQDWAFYPHTNDDLLAIGIMLSDISENDGPLQMIPGSHKAAVLPHSRDGVFCGAVDPSHPDVDLSKAVSVTGKAGDMSIHHVRTLHGSAPNYSDSPRLLLLYECGAADAWPLAGNQSAYTGLDQIQFWQKLNESLICGEQSVVPRLHDVPVIMPLAPAPDASSIFQVQATGGAVDSFASNTA